MHRNAFQVSMFIYFQRTISKIDISKSNIAAKIMAIHLSSDSIEKNQLHQYGKNGTLVDFEKIENLRTLSKF